MTENSINFLAKSVIILAISLSILIFVESSNISITGKPIQSDGEYISPTTGPGYVAPQVGPGYEKVTTGPGYQKVDVGPGFQKADIGQGYVAVVSDKNYSSPQLGSGYIRPSTNNISNNIENVSDIETNISKNNTNIIEKPKTDLPEDVKKEQPEKKGRIDKKLAGTWRVYSDSIYYPDGNFKYRTTPDSILDIYEDGTWSFKTFSGTWYTENIIEQDWKTWGVNAYGPIRKIILSGLPERELGGPIEEDLTGINFLWAIYDEPQGQVWQKFGPVGKQRIFVEGVVSGTRVLSADKKIDCGEICIAQYNYSSIVTIKAFPGEGKQFLAWLAGCQGTAPTCIIDLKKPTTVIPLFTDATCTSNDQCPLDQICKEGSCIPLDCQCGFANNHQCQEYACCSDTQCGEGNTCDTTINQCIQKSACREVVKKGDPKDKLDIVFVGDGFRNYDHLKQGISLLMDYDNKYKGFFSVTPLKENKDKFNVWMVLAQDYNHYESGEPDIDDYHRFVKTCERDVIVVFSSKLFRPHAAFATENKGGIVYFSIPFGMLKDEGAHMGKTFLHEMGHAIGSLADEYVEYGKGSRNLESVSNCAANLERAQTLWSDLVGVRGVDYYTGVPNVTGTIYYKSPKASIPELGLFPDGSDFGDGGCSYDWKNIRPTILSLMGNHFEATDYGPVNERVLSKKLEAYK